MYAHIEGEEIAVAWGFEQCRYFTQDCDNMLVVTDPLVNIFGDRTLQEIINARLLWLKQRTLPWLFDIMPMLGRQTTHAADAASLQSSPTGSIHSNCILVYMETVLMGAIQRAPESSPHYAGPT